MNATIRATIRDNHLTPSARLLFVLLWDRCGKRSYCWPSQQCLAADMGRSERQVRTYLDELSEAGLIRVQQRGQGRSSLYHVLALEVVGTDGASTDGTLQAHAGACSAPLPPAPIEAASTSADSIAGLGRKPASGPPLQALPMKQQQAAVVAEIGLTEDQKGTVQEILDVEPTFPQEQAEHLAVNTPRQEAIEAIIAAKNAIASYAKRGKPCSPAKLLRTALRQRWVPDRPTQPVVPSADDSIGRTLAMLKARAAQGGGS
jgi:hypothetical protein